MDMIVTWTWVIIIWDFVYQFIFCTVISYRTFVGIEIGRRNALAFDKMG